MLSANQSEGAEPGTAGCDHGDSEADLEPAGNASFRLGAAVLACGCIALNLLLLCEVLLFRSTGQSLLLGRYSAGFAVRAALPAFLLLGLNVSLMLGAWQRAIAACSGAKWCLLLGVIGAVLAACFYRVSSPRVVLYFATLLVYELAGLLLLRWRPQSAALMAMTCGLILVPLLAIETYLFHLSQYVVSLPDYNPPLVLKVSELPGNPGGLLRGNMDCTARGGARFGTIKWKTDSFGFRNSVQTTVGKIPGRTRILAMGDSFSAGYRLSQDQTFPKKIEDGLKALGRDVEVLNAETEDPVVAAWYLDKHGFSFSPDMVVMLLCIGNDFTEVRYRLTWSKGFEWTGKAGESPLNLVPERVDQPSKDYLQLSFPDGFLSDAPYIRPNVGAARAHPLSQFTLGRVWMSAKKQRAADPGWADGALTFCYSDPRGKPHPMDLTTGFGFFAKDGFTEVDQAYSQTRDVLKRIKLECQRRGIPFVLVAMPQVFQVYPLDWKANCSAYKLLPERFDLERPDRELKRICDELGIEFVDLLPPMKAESLRPGAARLYLRGGDMHWNAGGAAFSAAVVVDQIKQLIPNK